ncbi:hypothetical protein [Salinicola peritrichatus]
MDIFKGKTTVAEMARQHALTVSECKGWIEATYSHSILRSLCDCAQSRR